MAYGLAEALAMLTQISDLDDYHAARGSYLSDLGDVDMAVDAFQRGRDTATNDPQRQFFTAKLEALTPDP